MKLYTHAEESNDLFDELCEFNDFVDDNNRRQKKLLKKMYILQKIKPKTENQKLVFQHWHEGKNLLLHGCAGSGKTFLALYLALRALQEGECESIYVVRSAVSSRDIGFLPGTLNDKMSLYELPYRDVFKSLTDKNDIYDKLKEKNYYHFMSTSYVRGLNIDNAIIILDEAQNCSFHELDSIMTRVGENSRIILCGDTAQNDLQMHKKGISGLDEMLQVVDKLPHIFGRVHFSTDDIVRSGFVKQYLLAKISLGII